jgi:hypothetical protein
VTWSRAAPLETTVVTAEPRPVVSRVLHPGRRRSRSRTRLIACVHGHDR